MGDEDLELISQAVGEKTRGSQPPRHYAARVTLLAAQDRPTDAVMLPLPSFRLHPGEPLGMGLQRLCLAELETAVGRFYDGEEAFAERCTAPASPQSGSGPCSDWSGRRSGPRCTGSRTSRCVTLPACFRRCARRR